ncbi:MAG: hypothetical protein IK095_05810, partial [Oscillospiraceae bacterium]|nr:hypothetical protein [Oscillospiraceae bacterium]
MGTHESEKKLSVWKLILLQILLTGLVLCVFSLFHHVIPHIRLLQEGMPGPIGSVERQEEPLVPVSPAPTADVAPGDETVAADPGLTPAPTPEPVPETWQERFAEHFTEEIRWTENSYSSPRVSVTVTEHARPEDFPGMTYYVADIYLSDLDCFRTGFPEYGTFDNGEGIARANEAILAVNGDSMLTQRDGLLIRNGQIYKQMPNMGDLCVLFYDGSMEIFPPEQIDVDAILAR